MEIKACSCSVCPSVQKRNTASYAYHQPTSTDPRRDVDLASYGLVSMLPQGPGSGYQGLGWRPRLAFEDMAELKAG